MEGGFEGGEFGAPVVVASDEHGLEGGGVGGDLLGAEVGGGAFKAMQAALGVGPLLGFELAAKLVDRVAKGFFEAVDKLGEELSVVIDHLHGVLHVKSGR